MNRALIQAGAAALAIAIFSPVEALPAAAEPLARSFSDKSTRTIDLPAGGAFWIDNAIGSVVVSGEGDRIVVETTRVLRAADDATLESLKKRTSVVVEAKGDSRIVKSKGLVANARMHARVDYLVKVPPSTIVNVLSGVAEKVRLSGLSGKVYVRNWRGNVEVFDATDAVQIDTVNTNVLVSYSRRPGAAGQFSSVNGDIEVRVPQQARFEWLAETMQGDILAGFPVSGRAVDSEGQRSFRASVNGGSGIALRATSITGKIRLMAYEKPAALVVSVLPQAPQRAPVAPATTVEQSDVGTMFREVVSTVLVQPPDARVFKVRKGRVAGNYEYGASLGENVFVGEIDGYARIVAAGGEVVLGRVAGDCKVSSQGGPINLGEISGSLDARTLAGNVSVGSAKKGGKIHTGAGSVEIRAASGPLTVDSNGGDLFITSSGRVSAVTRSGDVRVRLDGAGATGSAELRTGRGNAVLEIPKGARMNIDATITTDADATHRFESEFPGLTVVRERVGDRLRIRATGGINGGGPTVTIRVDSGNIALRRAAEKVAGAAGR